MPIGRAVLEVGELEARRCRALIDADYDTLQSLLHDGLVYTHSTGRVDSKASYMAGKRSAGTRYRRNERSDMQFVAHGNLVLCTGRALWEVERDGNSLGVWTIRYSNAWLGTAAGWQMLLWHATNAPLAGGGTAGG